MDRSSERNIQMKVPLRISLLIFLSLLFVPGLYLVLLVSAAFALSLAGAMGYGIYMLFLSMWHYYHGAKLYIILFTLAGFLIFGVLIGLLSIARAIYLTIYPPYHEDPCLIIREHQEPTLFRFIQDLCSRLNTRFPDAILLNPRPDFYVTQSKMKVFNGELVKGRILSISLPMLYGLTVNEIRAILAHEFGHFTGRDTLFSKFVAPVYIGTEAAIGQIEERIAALAEGNSAIYVWCAYLPLLIPKWALICYLWVFHFLKMTISRYREQRADTVAVLTCGTESHRSALRKASDLIDSFQIFGYDYLNRQLDSTRALQNYYNLYRESMPQLLARVGESKTNEEPAAAKTGYFDSHCSDRERMAYVPEVPEKFVNPESATKLFKNLEEYEKLLGQGYVRGLDQYRMFIEAINAQRNRMPVA